MKREDVHRSMKRKKGQEKLKRRLALAEAERKDPEARKVSKGVLKLVRAAHETFTFPHRLASPRTSLEL